MQKFVNYGSKKFYNIGPLSNIFRQSWRLTGGRRSGRDSSFRSGFWTRL